MCIPSFKLCVSVSQSDTGNEYLVMMSILCSHFGKHTFGLTAIIGEGNDVSVFHVICKSYFIFVPSSRYGTASGHGILFLVLL